MQDVSFWEDGNSATKVNQGISILRSKRGPELIGLARNDWHFRGVDLKHLYCNNKGKPKHIRLSAGWKKMVAA